MTFAFTEYGKNYLNENMYGWTFGLIARPLNQVVYGRMRRFWRERSLYVPVEKHYFAMA